MITAEKVISHFSTKWTVTKFQDFVLVGKCPEHGSYINIRRKAEASYHRRTKRFEFGIPRRDWDRYTRMVQEGKQVYSLIVEGKEEEKQSVYFAQIKDLLPHARVYHGDDVDKGGTVFLPRDKYLVHTPRE